MLGTRALTALALAAIGLYTLLLTWPGLGLDSTARSAVGQAGILLAVLSTLGSALVAARRQEVRRARWSWLLVAAGLVCVCLGVGYSIWHDLAHGGQPSFPSWADVCYLLGYPLFISALVTRPIQRTRDINRWLLMLDVGVMVCAVLAVSWVLIFSPLFGAFATDSLSQAVMIAYPVGDVGIMLCLVVFLLRESRSRLPTVLFIVGAGAIAVDDSLSVAMTAAGGYTPGDPIDAVWFAGMVLIGLGAALDPPRSIVAQRDLFIGRPWQFVAPAALVVLMGSVVWVGPLIWAQVWPDPGQTALALGVALMLARYVLSYRDTVLAHNLLAQQAAERERAQAAREEAARMEGVLLTARELAHLLNNDLAIVVGAVDMLRYRYGSSADGADELQDAELGLERMTERVRQLQQISRIKLRETPVGSSLDLERSASRQPAGRPA